MKELHTGNISLLIG